MSTTLCEELFDFLAALEYPLGDQCTTLQVLRAWARKGGIVAVENLVLGGEWHPKGWNGIEECRFIPHPHLSLEELQGLNPDSERGHPKASPALRPVLEALLSGQTQSHIVEASLQQRAGSDQRAGELLWRHRVRQGRVKEAAEVLLLVASGTGCDLAQRVRYLDQAKQATRRSGALLAQIHDLQKALTDAKTEIAKLKGLLESEKNRSDELSRKCDDQERLLHDTSKAPSMVDGGQLQELEELKQRMQEEDLLLQERARKDADHAKKLSELMEKLRKSEEEAEKLAGKLYKAEEKIKNLREQIRD
eukprot:g12691.t1